MDNKCPKCGKKLSIFYIKQSCPKCGCDLLYYDMETSLERDSEKAEKEFAALDAFIEKRVPKFIKKRMNK